MNLQGDTIYMNTITESIKIVKYHEDLAKSIADMWNESRDSWGGDASVTTEEQVKKQQANSEDLVLYLALDNEKVVGYCGISEYKEDSNALYIRLLNVHPDYHGKKIGKHLVLKAVEKTVELGFPRIDLYTWPGNVKAVPLYKKCGFFWEDRDDTTHLMNFIPMVLQNELIKPHFEHLDWYKDNVRAIEVKPDGIKENGFTYFEYVWENETRFLRVQIEKSGRGIRLIETNDVLMEASINEHNQIEGRESVIELLVRSKSAEKLSVAIEGYENERIHVNGKQVTNIPHEDTFKIPVHIKDGEEPNEWVTHPRAEVKITINGLSSLFAIGIYPKKALKVKTVYHPKKYDLNKEQYCFLELENHLKKTAEVIVELQNNDQVEWKNHIVKTEISEKGIIKIPFIIQKYGFLQSECSIKVQSAEETFEWKEPLAFPIPAFGIKAGGYDKDYIYLQNGFYKVQVRKRNNTISLGNGQNWSQRTFLLPPKFGKPYIGELSKKQVSTFEWDHNTTAAKMKLYYDVQKPYRMKLSLCFELFAEGLLNYWVEIENQSENSFENVFVFQPIQHHLNQTYMPIKNEIVYFNDARMTHFGELNSKDVSGNWIFSDNEKEPHGITWSESVQLGFDGWYFYLEEELGMVRPNETVKAKPVNFSLGAIKNVEDFQNFANQNTATKSIAKEIELKPERSNPVIKNNQHTLILEQIQNRYFDGKLKILENGKGVQEVPVKYEDNQNQSIGYQSNTTGFIPIQYELENESKKIEGSLLLLHQGQSGIKMNQVEDGKHVSCEIENGDLKFKAAASFFPTLYSISYKGQEWLDSMYPEPKPKAWWNPWAGGMWSYLSGISLFSFLKETSKSCFVKKIDKLQNEWQGLVIETTLEKHEKWKGLNIRQYFLTLPGVPIIAHFTELEHMNQYINQYLVTEMWWKKNALNETIVQLQNKSGSKKFRAGFEEHDFQISNPYTITGSDETQKLQVFSTSTDLESDCVLSEEFAQAATATYLNIEPGTKFASKPVFLLFPEKSYNKEMLESLKWIQF